MRFRGALNCNHLLIYIYIYFLNTHFNIAHQLKRLAHVKDLVEGNSVV